MGQPNYKKYLSKLIDAELIALRDLVEAELNKRGISFNVGLIGEQLVINHFNSTPGLPNLLQAPTGAKNVDALSREGDRYFIKTFLKARKNGTIYPDGGNSEKQLFEYLVVAQLNTEYQLNALYRYNWGNFLKVRAWDKRMNACYVPLSRGKLKEAEVVYQK